MKILVCGINFYPELTGIGKYTGEMVEYWQNSGHEVRVITAPPYYPEWRLGAGYSSAKYKSESVFGATVYRCPIWIPRRVSGITRLLHLASFAISSIPVLFRNLRWRPDFVWTVEPSLMTTPGVLLYSRLVGAKCGLHIQDFEVDAAFDLGIVKSKKIKTVALAFEKYLMSKFDLVSSISHNMVSLLKKKGVPEENSYLFKNWVDTQSITPVAGVSIYRAELGISRDSVVALYSGNMGAKQGLEVLAELAHACLSLKNVVFVFCGNGAGKAELARSTAGLNNVRFIDLQPKDKLNELLGLADIHLLPQRADAADLVMPSKLTGMMASGRPVIATASHGTELAAVVCNDAKCGLVVEPGQTQELMEALLTLASNWELRLTMGESGRRYAENELAKENILKRYTAHISRIAA